MPTQNSHTKLKAAIAKTDDEIMNLLADSFGEYKLQFSTSSSLSEVLANQFSKNCFWWLYFTVADSTKQES